MKADGAERRQRPDRRDLYQRIEGKRLQIAEERRSLNRRETSNHNPAAARPTSVVDQQVREP